ncbi:Intracellular exo-alpha-L-arabinofuranosidase 2 [Posidoniimonas polymericola]|uniref:non-reducing end alpha-L-arabinofuranosidase n=1 Tax=Posidoniimonas polymericola TaxID=2528002 RepID=A0A5C5XZS7_9BACT|nr:alpha-N-arabinofuranosidase [Posidoniimonas polymericola]TWT66982.1 Intracellular exo-alpha-L-arabinofuranosidase 2 [Posidoniimonas polymericola]
MRTATRLATTLLLTFLASSAATQATAGEATAVIRADQEVGKISRHVYGHFAEHLGRCIYDGIWVGKDSSIPNTDGVRNDVFDALKKLEVPNLRWPGGCFADDYHWRDGIGPKDQRPKRINMHWGQVTDTNAFGTHEFLDLCEKLGADAYLAGNVGSGTPDEMRDWLEYMTFDGDSELANLRRQNGREEPWKVPFFGVGNENWGCGGNMRPEYYADLYRRYATYCRNFSGDRITLVACGANGHDANWTKVMTERIGRRMPAISLHYYTVYPAWANKTTATGFGEKEWAAVLSECLRMRSAIGNAEESLDEIDPNNRIGLYVDEWGAWYQNEPGTPGYALYQQNSLRDALLAGITLHIFHEHNDRVRVANIAQVVNVLQAMILTDGDKMLLTPSYHLFEMYRVHHDATRLPVELESPEYSHEGHKLPAVSLSASRSKEGVVNVSIVNAHASEAMDLTCTLEGVDGDQVSGRVLTADKLDAHNTFDAPEVVAPTAFNDAKLDAGKLSVRVPAHSVVVLSVE